MRMLVVAPQPFFTPRGTPISVYHRTRIAAELGLEIDLLTYGEGRDVDLPGVRIIRVPRIKVLEPVRVGPSFAKLVLDALILIWAVGLLVRHRYEVVHAHEEAVFFCTYLKHVFRYKLVYDMHSSLPQQLTNFGFTESRILIGLFERLEKAALRTADAVITISPALAEYAIEYLGGEDRHVLIENTLVDPIRLRHDGEGEQSLRVPVEVPAGVPVVTYAGTFEAYQGIDLLLESHARVLEQRPDVFLLMIGGSATKVAQYEQMARELGIDHACLFTGFLPQEEARRLLRESSLVVSPRTRGTNTPLKVYEQLAGGVPLVATRIASHTQVLSEAVCFLADPEPESFSQAILEALGDSGRRASTVAAAQELYRTRYSTDQYVAKMRRVLALID